MYRHQPHYPHNQGITGIIKDWREAKLSSALDFLYANRILQDLAGGLLGIFLPILLYKAFDSSLYKTGVFYLIGWAIWFFVAPLGAKVMSRIGMKRSLIISVLVGWSWYFLANKFLQDSSLVWLGLMIVAITVERMFYWIPYHTDFAKFTNKKMRGRQMTFLYSLSALLHIFLPFISGEILTYYGFGILFSAALVVYLLSVIPLFFIPDIRETYSFSYLQTYRELFRRIHRRLLFSYGADGMQNVVGMVVWPLFIWLLLDKNYQAVGLISSFIIFANVILTLLMGDFVDKLDKRRLLRWGSVFNSLGWIFKMFVGTGFQVFIASTYHGFANIVMRTPYEVMMYEKAADSGHYIDEYTVLRELSLTLGRVLMVGVLFLVFFLTGSLVYPFLVAALAALVVSVV